jgi:hypothetical protein
MELKVFEMYRPKDKTGISGTGLVLVGVIYPNGKVIVNWGDNGIGSSMGIYESYDDFLNIHVRSHPTNRTQIKWLKVHKGA